MFLIALWTVILLFVFISFNLISRPHHSCQIFLHFEIKLLLSLLSKWNHSLDNCRPCSAPNNFSKVCESVIHNSVSHSFKSIFNCCQHGFIKSISTVAIFARRPQVAYPPLHSQHQLNVVHYSEFSNILKLFCEIYCTEYWMIRN